MAKHKLVLNASTGKSERIDLTPEEEAFKIKDAEAAMARRQLKIDEMQVLKDKKAALQAKLELSDEEMDILGKAGNIR